jgi:CRISPR-associated protein Csm4
MIKQYKIIRLEHFKGGLHLARGLTNSYDNSLKTLHSDTLKSAIFVCALQLSKENDVIDKSFLESFKISSAFPFYKETENEDKKYFYFFPKPELSRPFKFSDNTTDLSDKDKKKINFIGSSIFERYIKNVEKFEFTSEELNFPNLLNNKDYKSLIKSDTYQHVAITRDDGNDSTPYYVDKIYFHSNSGLYFLVETDDETFKKVKSAMQLLADNGIGTDRNTGNGQFEVAFDTMDLEVPDDGNYDLSLSLYCPEKKEIGQLDESFYGLTKRGGYISSPQNEENLSIRKRSIYMFTEGSVFPKMENDEVRKGKIVDLKPNDEKLAKKNIYINHPIWRDGQPIFIPMKYN